MINKFKNTQSYITNFSKELAKLLKIEIGRKRRRTSAFGRNYSTPIDSSGRLRKNTEPQQIDITENKLSVNIESLVYGDIVDKGRNPRQKPPPVKDILQWIKDKPVRIRDIKGKIVKNRERYFLQKEGSSISGQILNDVDVTDQMNGYITGNKEALFQAIERNIFETESVDYQIKPSDNIL